MTTELEEQLRAIHKGPIDMTLLDSELAGMFAKAYERRSEIFQDDAIKLPGVRGAVVKYSEEDLIRQVLWGIERQFQQSGRAVMLPGLRANFNLIVGMIAAFKESEMPNRNIRSFAVSNDNDIAVGMGFPEHFGYDNWQRPGLALGDVFDVLGDPAVPGDRYEIEDDEWLFFTGDFIDLDTDAVVSLIQYTGVDGETYEPESIYLSERGTDLQMSQVQAACAKETILVQAQAMDNGDAELLPVIVVVTKGANLAQL